MATRSRGKEEQFYRDLLRALRKRAGLRQVDLATRLRRPQSFVSNYELGERRLDVLELREICRLCGTTLTAFTVELEARLASGRAKSGRR